MQVLKDHFVLVDQEERRERIRKQITELAREEGGEVEIAPDLLEEVTYLVEYPTALCGRFEENTCACRKRPSSRPCGTISAISRSAARTAGC